MKKIALLIMLLILPGISFAADYYTAATAREQVRMLLMENTNNFFTDTELDNWVNEATENISSKALCIQVSDTILLVTSQYEYTEFVVGGAASATDVVKVWGCFYVSPDNEYIGLKRIYPKQIADLPYMAAGPPKYYYHYADKIGFLPLPTSAENGESVRIYYAEQSQTIGDLPNEYQPLTFWYAAAMALKRSGKPDSDKFYQMYLTELNALKQELYDVPPEQKTP